MVGDTVMAPHLGITLRSVFGCAIANKQNFTGNKFKVQYKGATIAEMTLGKDFK